MERYNSILAKNKTEFTQSAYDLLMMKPLNTLEELDEAYAELIHFLKHSAYYKLLERIDKGEKMVEEETDPVKKRQYQELLKIRYAELEKLIPKEEAA